jgi:hypothetical protein
MLFSKLEQGIENQLLKQYLKEYKCIKSKKIYYHKLYSENDEIHLRIQGIDRICDQLADKRYSADKRRNLIEKREDYCENNKLCNNKNKEKRVFSVMRRMIL